MKSVAAVLILTASVAAAQSSIPLLALSAPPPPPLPHNVRILPKNFLSGERRHPGPEGACAIPLLEPHQNEKPRNSKGPTTNRHELRDPGVIRVPGGAAFDPGIIKHGMPVCHWETK